MPLTSLQSEIESLIKFFSLTGRGDLISIITGDKTSSLDAALSIIGFGSESDNSLTGMSTEQREQLIILQELICDTTEGAYTTHDIAFGTGKEYIDGFEEDIKNFIKVYYEPTSESSVMPEQHGIKSMCRTWKRSPDRGQRESSAALTSPEVNDETSLSDPSRYHHPSLSAIVLSNLSLGPPTRNADAVALFANGMPTLELSRCVPFINLRFVSVTTELLSERTKQLSLLRFLGESATGEGSGDNIGLSKALPDLQSTGITSEFGSEEGAASAGMELFTTPQTLINADINRAGGNSSGRVSQVLDPFKPLMTLNSVSITIQGLGRALLSSKIATVQLTLHDRSRLADIAPIVAIDLFGMTSVLLEYGWSHPEGNPTSNNPIGRFLNSLRSKQLFNITSSNYTMGNDGQVKITLRLAARGMTASTMVPAATGELFPTSIFKPMLTAAIAKSLQSIDETDDTRLKEIRDSIRVTLNNANSPSSVVPRSLFQEFLTAINDKSSKGTTALANVIEDMIGSSGQEAGPEASGLYALNESLTSAFDDKAWALIHADATDDFLPDDTVSAEIFPGQSSGTQGRRYVSLGKLIMVFVGYPLAACGRFDEVQVIFYRFNMQAAFARRFDISQFMIDADDLMSKLDKLKDRSPGISISGFMQFLDTNYVSNPANPNYGLAKLYTEKSALLESKKEYEKKHGELSQAEKDSWQQSFASIEQGMESRLREIYGADNLGGAKPEFNVPDLKFYMETMPVIVPSDDDNPRGVDDSKTILKLHVFDRSATPYSKEMFLLSALTDSEVTAIIDGTASAPSEVDADQQGTPESNIGDESVGSRVEEVASDNDTMYKTVVANVSATSIKKAIKSSVPSLNFGSQFSSIKSINLSATTQGAVANTMLVSAIMDTDPQVGTSTPVPMEDIKVIPAKIGVVMEGCPLIEYGQQFFLDMDTGTTADNIYGVINLTHNLGPGKFETTFDLNFQSNGTISSIRSELAKALPRLRALSDNTDTS